MPRPYLYEHPNQHAPERSNGIRFHGYPDRAGVRIQGIGLHTAENLPDLTPPDLGAENVAAYFATTKRAASAHVNVDSDTVVLCLPDEAVAFAARGYNRAWLHIEMCTQAHRWHDLPDEFKTAILNRAASVVAHWCESYGIPVVELTRAEADAGARGLARHSTLDPSRRTDPGAGFPMDHFLSLVRERLGAPVPSAATGRVSGPDAFATAAAMARRNFPDPALVDVCYLARGDTGREIDAVVASQATDGPVLLVAGGHLPQTTADALAHFRPAEVVAVGGPAAVSTATLLAAGEAARR